MEFLLNLGSVVRALLREQSNTGWESEPEREANHSSLNYNLGSLGFRHKSHCVKQIHHHTGNAEDGEGEHSSCERCLHHSSFGGGLRDSQVVSILIVNLDASFSF